MTQLTAVDFDPFASPALLRSAPSTQSQRELWTASQLGHDASLAFNEAVALDLSGPLSTAALTAALQAVVAAHEALHTAFSEDGTLLLVEEPTLEVGYEDLSQLPEAERLERVAQARRRQVTEPFALQRSPLLRAQLLHLAAESHTLLLSAHHIVCDGWSMAVILADLAEAYSRAVIGQPAQLAPRPLFSDYARAEEQSATSQEMRAAEQYWLRRFVEELPPLELPVDRPRPTLKTYPSARLDYTLDRSLVDQLRAFGATRRASQLATLLAAFQVLVARLANSEDLVVGVPAAGQSVGDLPQLVGHCVNMLPLRSRIRRQDSFTKLLEQVRRDLLDATSNQQLTYGSLLTKLVLPRDPSRLPLINLSFNVDHAVTGESLHFANLGVRVSTTPRAFETFELFVNAAEKPEGLVLETQYNTDLFDAATVRRWLESYEVLLRGILNDPETAVGDLPLASQAEQQLLAEWNAATLATYPKHESLAGRLLRHAAVTPERPALVARDATLTYGELDRRSASIAAMLRARGIGAGSLVGICLERSSRLLLAVLGVLRAGAAYVPLDPSFPKDRLAFMAQDALLSLLLSERALEPELPAPEVA